jgi:hypothetical protein
VDTDLESEELVEAKAEAEAEADEDSDIQEVEATN